MSIGTVRQWHWISSAICLVGMLLFAITGITLNHAGQIEGRARVTTVERILPAALMKTLTEADGTTLPSALRDWLADELGIDLGGGSPEWSDGELYIGLPRPGGDAWLSIDLESGELLYERTDRGWIAYLNDLHKGRDTGAVWRWFIDIFAVACVIFCITGLLLLQRHAATRPSTWPLVGAGLVIPMLLALLFMHT
ncbi:MAG: PepSY-associated TM helix domain-containing protein [Spongiibacteraceae bacterium]|jgi:hypothetical protein|nr:PepSY-associated TM helix domain-containing protein [Spongiibacteraceae bacterium]